MRPEGMALRVGSQQELSQPAGSPGDCCKLLSGVLNEVPITKGLDAFYIITLHYITK